MLKWLEENKCKHLLSNELFLHCSIHEPEPLQTALITALGACEQDEHKKLIMKSTLLSTKIHDYQYSYEVHEKTAPKANRKRGILEENQSPNTSKAKFPRTKAAQTATNAKRTFVFSGREMPRQRLTPPTGFSL